MFRIKETQSPFIGSHSGLLHVAVQVCCWLRPACMKTCSSFFAWWLAGHLLKHAIEPLDDGSGSIVLLLSWCLTLSLLLFRPFLDSVDFFLWFYSFCFYVGKFIVSQRKLACSVFCPRTWPNCRGLVAQVLAGMFAWARVLVAHVLEGMLVCSRYDTGINDIDDVIHR